MGKGVSNREFARLLGLSSDNAVRKARKAGRIHGAAILDDGTIDPDIAMEQWRARTDARQQRKVTEHTDAGRPSSPPPARPTPIVDDDAAPAAESPAPKRSKKRVSDDGEETDTTSDANYRLLLQKEAKGMRELAAIDGLLIDRGLTLRLVADLAKDLRDSYWQILDKQTPIMAAKLGVDEHAMFEAFHAALTDHFHATIERFDMSRYERDIMQAKAAVSKVDLHKVPTPAPASESAK